MQLEQIAPLNEWLELERELHGHFHMNCTVYNAQGAGVTGSPNWCNSLCPRIKANKESLATICAACNQNMMRRMEKTRAPVVDECDAGLLKYSVPILVNGEFLGAAGGCGRLPENGELEAFLIHKASGMDEKEIDSLGKSVETVAESEIKSAVEYVINRLDEIIRSNRGKTQ